MGGDSSFETAADGLRFEQREGREDSDLAAWLGDEVAARFGPRDEAVFSIVARDGGERPILGGLNGAIHWRWLYVRHLWVAAPWRGQGLGRRLMIAAERLARERGCVGLYLDTFDPAAVAFYERCGFSRCGRIADFPPGHARTFLSKALGAPVPSGGAGEGV